MRAEGQPFLLKFGVALVSRLEPELLRAPTPAAVYALLRLDRSLRSAELDIDAVARGLVAAAAQISLDGVDISARRKDLFESKIRVCSLFDFSRLHRHLVTMRARL
jgi:hypothetical protein